jgi:hypothetical protein
MHPQSPRLRFTHGENESFKRVLTAAGFESSHSQEEEVFLTLNSVKLPDEKSHGPSNSLSYHMSNEVNWTWDRRESRAVPHLRPKKPPHLLAIHHDHPRLL